jgi:cysteinyl-tRNA synthetase
VLDEINTLYTTIGGDVLGVVANGDVASSNGQREAGLIELLISLRAQARVNKNYAESDRIRNELAKLGVQLEDRADGTIWRVG